MNNEYKPSATDRFLGVAGIKGRLHQENKKHDFLQLGENQSLHLEGKQVVETRRHEVQIKHAKHQERLQEIEKQLLPLKEKGMLPSSPVQQRYEAYLSLVESYQQGVLFANHASDIDKVAACARALGEPGIARDSSIEEMLAYYQEDWEKHLQKLVELEDAGLTKKSNEQAFFDELYADEDSEKMMIDGYQTELNDLEELSPEQLVAIGTLNRDSEKLRQDLENAMRDLEISSKTAWRDFLRDQMEIEDVTLIKSNELEDLFRKFKWFVDGKGIYPQGYAKLINLLTDTASNEPLYGAYLQKANIYEVGPGRLAEQIREHVMRKAIGIENIADHYSTYKKPLDPKI